MGRLSTTIAAGIAFAVTVVAHGHVQNIVVNGVYWEGYDGTSFPYLPTPPTVVGWTYAGTDNGFVSPDAFQTSDIICHKSATPAGAHAVVKAGDMVSLQWLPIPWPDSHHGPVLDYLANCNGPCETVDKTALKWFKIDGPGLLSGGNPGYWATDVLISNNSTWLVQIPPTLAAGNYVLRHEIIALHSAGSTNGAQAYPQCINLQVTGGGSLQPSGIPATEFYKSTDPGILFNIYASPLTYTIPGPTIVSGLPVSVPQSSSVATATSAPVLPGGGSGGGSSTSTTTTTTPGKTSTTSTTTQTAKSTTFSTTTSKSTPTTTITSTANGGGQQTKYGQCGGSGWTGPTACAGSTCSTLNAYYAQCV